MQSILKLGHDSDYCNVGSKNKKIEGCSLPIVSEKKGEEKVVGNISNVTSSSLCAMLMTEGYIVWCKFLISKVVNGAAAMVKS